MSDFLLEVRHLITAFDTSSGLQRAVDEVSFELKRGNTLGIVGESGCGKSVTAMSIAQLLPHPSGRILEGEIWFKGRDLLRESPRTMQRIRGREMGVIFQEPMTALNPSQRIGHQLCEAFLLHQQLSRREAWQKSIEMLRRVRIPEPELRMMDYPRQFSGGMRQRIVIAMALACEPDLVIADEPTTALDVTVQAQVLHLIKDLQQQSGMAMILITHDLGVIAETCDEVIVMYAGRLVERASVVDLFANPRHAYTKSLLESMPRLDSPHKQRLPTIPGMVASLNEHVHGCRFCQRLQREGTTLLERPLWREVAPQHWVEACPICAG